jgi:hypothetical protein
MLWPPPGFGTLRRVAERCETDCGEPPVGRYECHGFQSSDGGEFPDHDGLHAASRQARDPGLRRRDGRTRLPEHGAVPEPEQPVFRGVGNRACRIRNTGAAIGQAGEVIPGAWARSTRVARGHCKHRHLLAPNTVWFRPKYPGPGMVPGGLFPYYRTREFR